jgi:hypothetical protein
MEIKWKGYRKGLGKGLYMVMFLSRRDTPPAPLDRGKEDR